MLSLVADIVQLSLAHSSLYLKNRFCTPSGAKPGASIMHLFLSRRLKCPPRPLFFPPQYFCFCFSSHHCFCRQPHWSPHPPLRQAKQPNRGHIGTGGAEPHIPFFLSRVSSAVTSTLVDNEVVSCLDCLVHRWIWFSLDSPAKEPTPHTVQAR